MRAAQTIPTGCSTFGWNDWYLSLDAIYQSGFTKSPTVKWGIGYEGFLHLLNQIMNPS